MRITEKNLEMLVESLNKITGSPLTSYTKYKSGKYKANLGNFHLDFAYGGVSLHRMQNLNGGIEDIFQKGHMTKRQLWDLMQDYIRGIQYDS